MFPEIAIQAINVAINDPRCDISNTLNKALIHAIYAYPDYIPLDGKTPFRMD